MKKRWSKNDLRLLKERYADSRNDELAKIMGRTTQAVALKANKMGLVKSEALRRRRAEKAARWAELDAILADIHKSNNNIYHKSKI